MTKLSVRDIVGETINALGQDATMPQYIKYMRTHYGDEAVKENVFKQVRGKWFKNRNKVEEPRNGQLSHPHDFLTTTGLAPISKTGEKKAGLLTPEEAADLAKTIIGWRDNSGDFVAASNVLSLARKHGIDSVQTMLEALAPRG